MQLSAVVITYNESRNIRRCLESLAGIADELLVVDSQSTDDTVAIAEQYGARVVLQPFLGYIEQKNFAAGLAAYDWVISLDADEQLSEELRAEITAVKALPAQAVQAYRMPRLTNYCGHWVRHCGWYPDRKIRLFDRRAGQWAGTNPHDEWKAAQPGASIAQLRGDILHYSYDSISGHLKQVEHFTEIMARDAVAAGKSAAALKVVTAPLWKFFKSYLLQLGFLDGYYGYVICRISAFATFSKYAKIRQYSRKEPV